MKRFAYVLMIPGLWFGLNTAAFAGKHYATPVYAMVVSIDPKTRVIGFSKARYKLRRGVKIHDSESRLPSISDIKVGKTIKFKTRKNRANGQVEISEVWIIYE